MCFSDSRFPYGPFPPHWVPRHYIENYFSLHQADRFLVLSTTVENLSRIPGTQRWKLTLRRKDSVRHVDMWWEEEFDAVILANGHYSVPFVSLHPLIPEVLPLGVPLTFHWHLGSQGRWPRGIHPPLSRTDQSLQGLPQFTGISQQESRRHWKLGIRPRCRRSPRRCRPWSCLSIAPVTQSL